MDSKAIAMKNLKPYMTISVFMSPDASLIVNELQDKMIDILKTLPNNVQSINCGMKAYEDEAKTYFAKASIYKIDSTPSWLGAEASDKKEAPVRKFEDFGITDTKNHLVILASYNGYLLVYASQDLMRSRLNELIEHSFIDITCSDKRGETSDKNRKASVSIRHTAQVINRKKIEAAFVRGDAKSTWMEGLHVPTIMKADRKILFGPDLRHALDPFGDQTYKYSAVVSEMTQGEDDIQKQYRVGVSFSKNTLWSGHTKTFEDFMAGSKRFVDILCENNSELPFQYGLPYLAKPTEVKLDDLFDAFEISYEIPDKTQEREILEGGEVAPEDKNDEGYQWYKRGSFNIIEDHVKGCEIITEALFDNDVIAKIKIIPVIYSDQKVELKIEILDYSCRKDDWRIVEFDKAMKKRDSRLLIRYGSGHVYQHGVLYSIEFKDVIFEKWSWLHFDANRIDIKKEKPLKETIDKNKKKIMVYDSSKLGTQDSMFCYIFNQAQTFIKDAINKDLSDKYLILCDDGAGELADFIIIDPDKTKNLIVSIHIKSIKKQPFQIATDDFSLLSSMALKNMGFLDRGILVKKIQEKIHHNGQVKSGSGLQCTRNEFLKILEAMPRECEKYVILFYPRNTKSAWNKAVSKHRAGNKVNTDVGRMRQLSILLSSTEESLKRLGTSLKVIGFDDE